MDDFFNDKGEKVEDQNQEPQKIKVGEKEYNQDELDQIVQLGETAREFETKWNRKIDQFYPDYTQKSQRLAELEREKQAREEAELRAKQEQGNLSPEDARRVALEEARKLGLITKEEFDTEVNKAVASALAVKDIIDDANFVIEEAAEKGQPKTTTEQLLRYMEENGIRKPEAAYKLMFEKELDAWKEKQLEKTKQPGLDTQTGSQPGSKQPEPPPPLRGRDALSAAITARLAQGAGRG